MSEPISKMQKIIDRGIKARCASVPDDEMSALWDAIKLLSRAQQQIMSDLEKVGRRADEAYFSTMRIGGDAP